MRSPPPLRRRRENGLRAWARSWCCARDDDVLFVYASDLGTSSLQPEHFCEVFPASTVKKRLPALSAL